MTALICLCKWLGWRYCSLLCVFGTGKFLSGFN